MKSKKPRDLDPRGSEVAPAKDTGKAISADASAAKAKANEADLRDEIHEAVAPAAGDTDTPSWGYGPGGGEHDGSIAGVRDQAALIRSIGRMGPSGPPQPAPTAPDGTDGRDEFDIDLYAHARGSIKDP